MKTSNCVMHIVLAARRPGDPIFWSGWPEQSATHWQEL